MRAPPPSTIYVTSDKGLEGLSWIKPFQSWVHFGPRSLETELAGLYMVDATHAIVEVDVEWLLDDDTNLRSTRLEQKWTEKNGKWLLMEEKHVSGAEGLFGEEVERDKPRRDTHFPTKVIR